MMAPYSTAIRMAISVLIEVLLPGGGGTASMAGKPPPKNENCVKEWIRKNMKHLHFYKGN